MKEHTVNTPSRSLCFRTKEPGFSLVELLIAMAIALVVIGAMYSVFTIQNKTFANQEDFVEMQQNVRSGMDMMAREIGLAGYNPLPVSTPFFGVTVNASQLQIKADLSGGGVIQNNEENIVYVFDTVNKRITRNISAGAQPFIENVQSFTFQYLDGSGNVTASSADVRQVSVTITGRTAKPDPAYTANGGYRTYTLTSVIAPRNLAY